MPITTEAFETKKVLNQIAVLEQEVRADNHDKLGEEMPPVHPEDVELMYLGKMVIELMRMKVANANRKAGYIRHYGEVVPDVETLLGNHADLFDKNFNDHKKALEKVAKKHPLASKLVQIKGFTGYRLAIIMSYIKDISRFDTPSKLVVYAGCGTKYGLKVCKKNIHAINEIKFERWTGKSEDYKPFGFNIRLAQQLFIAAESLIKAKGFFYNFYQNCRSRLEKTVINENRAYYPTPEEIKASKGKMKKETYYIKGRKNQSLAAWAHSNAMSRISRTLLHLIYTEWRTLRGLPARNPYPIEYLGHSYQITLQEVLNWDNAPKVL